MVKIFGDKLLPIATTMTLADKKFKRLQKNIYAESLHISQNVGPKDAIKVLPWVHTMISNAKRTLLGVHHMISKKYTQNYLDEFCYKVNRRNFGDKLFDRLLIACVTTNYQNIITHYR